ncbi:MAG TPA: hypothetical protein VIJ19_10215, partial [Opitutaceae bacterium]
MPRLLPLSLRRAATCVAALAGLIGCSAPMPAPTPAPLVVAPAPKPVPPKAAFDPRHPVMLGIDVLEAEGFAPLRGKT